MISKNLNHMIGTAEMMMRNYGEVVHTERWQANDISKMDMAKMVEVLHLNLRSKINSESLEYLRAQIKPNLPWADNHFMERVCGGPINPGIEWSNWPWSGSADKHREDEIFNHNYMERYWPKHAGKVPGPTLTVEEFELGMYHYSESKMPHFGIRGEYGDLDDLIQTLAFEPTTRQAYMPIWFPEDTSSKNTGRKPCTLGYHFIMRNGKLDIRYDIRSCDLARHFRDDVYMTIRLALFVLDTCRELNPDAWEHVEIGEFIMNITSLHMFVGDYQLKFKENPRG